MKKRNSHLPGIRGFSLVELLVSMTIGLFLLGGVFSVYLESQSTRRTAETIARMQEAGRIALMQISAEAQLAGYWGQTTFEGTLIGQNSNSPLAFDVDNDCAPAGSPLWILNLARELEAFNDNPYHGTCLDDINHVNNTDILVIRSTFPRIWTDAQIAGAEGGAGKIFIRSDAGRGELYEGGTTPPAASGFNSAQMEDHRYNVSLYYVRPWSYDAGDALPSLRRLVFEDIGVKARVQNDATEIATGVEDFQVQLGVKTGSSIRFVNPESSLIDSTMSNVVALRYWLLMRAELEESGYVNNATYTYADKSVTVNDGYRRMLFSKTVQLRNLTEAM